MRTNFEKKEIITKAINNLYDNLKDKPYGYKISWDGLEKSCGIGKMSKERLYYVSQRVNDMLMHDSKYLDTVIGMGKKILNPHEHIGRARKEVKRSVKSYKKAGGILATTNMDSLDDQQKAQVLDEAKKWSTLEHIHNELLKKKPKKLEEKNESQRMVFDLISYLKG